ncbi:MAG: hypothetical protein KatS3mg065_1041 [Chloroflexota bacterium]|nr:MAG: hypothetical protein KatS3mg065_1041 [Chloroflexota bacterium]
MSVVGFSPQFRVSSSSGRDSRSPRRRREGGQGLVEFAAVVPFFLFLLLGMLEFGFVFDHHLTISYATREGARAGAALANGGGPLGCGAGQSPNWTTVDPQIIAAVQRVLASPGSPIALNRIVEIRIYKATATGGEVTGKVNVWRYDPAGGPMIDGRALDFSPQTVGWPACERTNATANPDSLGVSLQYTYQFVTPLAAVGAFFGGGGPASLPISDRTVMALNPTQ